MKFRLFSVLFLLVMTLLVAEAQYQPLLLKENMALLKCDSPGENYRFTGSNAPGQLFLPGEEVAINLKLQKGNFQGVVKDFSIEIQEISTRNPEARSKEAYADTSGGAPLIGLEGVPIKVPMVVTFTDAAEADVILEKFPLPSRYGIFALILQWADKRQFLATLGRVPTPRADGTLESVPIFGEGQFMQGNLMDRAAMYSRMGVRGWRSELSWAETADYRWSWSRYDEIFAAAKANGQKIMVTLGGTPDWTRAFGPPTPAAGWTPDSGGYWGSGDWVCEPKWYQRYENWITAFCYRYWQEGQGGLWGLENYNEPWEGGGISGWARDCLEYREIQKHIAHAARTVDPRIKLLAASSIMNTEDKLYSDGSNEFDQYVDIFTDHYVPPSMSYGPMVARAHGKESMETETWLVGAEYELPQTVAQFMATGQKRISPWHPRVLFDTLPGKENVLIPTPVVTATAAFNYQVTGKTFEKIVFPNNLPWVYQFGKDDDKDALLVLFGKLVPIGGPKEVLMAQVNATEGGSIVIDNKDNLLQFYDLAGNPLYRGLKSVQLPLTIFPTYIKCPKGPVEAVKRIAMARIEGKRPLEILPHDFNQRINTPGTSLQVELHNCLNRTINGKLQVKTPTDIALQQDSLPFSLLAGEKKIYSFAIQKGVPQATNSYPCSFVATSDAGNAEYQEVMHVAIASKGSKIIDGKLDDWNDVPGITILSGTDKMDPTELIRRPWLALIESLPEATFGEVKLAWDDDNLYIAARVHDTTTQANLNPMAGRDENKYFHTAADDTVEPYASFLKKYPGRSFAETPYVYRYSPEMPPADSNLPVIPFRRDRLQIALDVVSDWHDFTPTTDRVPYGYHAVPDTDYEYSIYACKDGTSETWRQLAPGVPRIHDFPRQPRGKLTTGLVPGARQVVVRQGNEYFYEVAIPKSELALLKLQTGTTFGFNAKLGNGNGASAEFGHDKAVCKINGLTFHPYWERTPNCAVSWTLRD